MSERHSVEQTTNETKCQLGAVIILGVAIASPIVTQLNEVQHFRYSGLIAILLQIFLTIKIGRWVLKLENELRRPYGQSKIVLYRWWILIGSVFALITYSISEKKNENIYGVLDSSGYWLQQKEKTWAEDCDYSRLLTYNEEELRVTKNKFILGMATKFELENAEKDLGYIVRREKSCISMRDLRKVEISHHLYRLMLDTSIQPRK